VGEPADVCQAGALAWRRHEVFARQWIEAARPRAIIIPSYLVAEINKRTDPKPTADSEAAVPRLPTTT
jgi:hypothetical protein